MVVILVFDILYSSAIKLEVHCLSKLKTFVYSVLLYLYIVIQINISTLGDFISAFKIRSEAVYVGLICYLFKLNYLLIYPFQLDHLSQSFNRQTLDYKRNDPLKQKTFVKNVNNRNVKSFWESLACCVIANMSQGCHSIQH